ncbi:MAG: ABC transporter ATP-binding protein [Rhodothermales bacterium]|nr:ABC transporter ATP-binding protein [Rhodothermales bacterium]
MSHSDPQTATHAKSEGSFLTVNDLTKVYQEGDIPRTVLNGLDFVMAEGELVVLLGRSGSGKSTFLNLISGMDTATSGDVTFSGINLTAITEQERTIFRRENIGLIFQSFNLISTLTVLENILLPLELNGRLNETQKNAAIDFLEEVGLADRKDSYPDRLSGGEQQRVAIARALAHDPLLILADEPTGNLDYKTAEAVMGILQQLIHDAGRTMLIATHDRDIIALADRVVSLQGGVLIELSPEEASAR